MNQAQINFFLTFKLQSLSGQFGLGSLFLTVSGETSISLNSSGQYELSPSVRVLHLEQICVGGPLSQTDTRSLLQQASQSK